MKKAELVIMGALGVFGIGAIAVNELKELIEIKKVERDVKKIRFEKEVYEKGYKDGYGFGHRKSELHTSYTPTNGSKED